MALTEREFLDLDKKVAVMEADLIAHQRALEVARGEMDRRLEGMNKFREEMAADKLEFVPRFEWKESHETLARRVEEKVESLNKRLEDKSESLQGQVNRLDNFKWMATGIAVAISSLVGIAIHFMFPGK
jgi:predicted nuclease with TOPRIM domain